MPGGWPIRLSIASAVVLSMLILAALIIAVGWQGARQSLLDTASRSAADAGKLITEKSYRLLEPAQVTLNLLSTSSLTTASNLEQRLERLPTMVEVLTSNPLTSAIYAGYASGDFFMVRPLDAPQVRARFQAPPMSNFLVQSVQRTRSGQVQGEYLFYTASLKLVQRRPMPDYQFDPRTRGWFKEAINSSTTQTSLPYVFFSSRQIGLTMSRGSPAADVVLGIDVVLDDLAKGMESLRMSPHAELALVDQAGTVLVYPEMGKVVRQEGDQLTFAGVNAIGVPALAALFDLQPPHGDVALFDVEGQEWLGVVLPFEGWHGEVHRLLITAPSDDLLGDLRQKRRKLGILILMLVLALLPVGWLVGATIGRSLDQLTHKSARMVGFDFQDGPEQHSWVLEVNRLAAALKDTGETIQTFLNLSHTMGTERQMEAMLSGVLDQLVHATRCSGGAVYLWDACTGRMECAARTAAVDGFAQESMDYVPGQSPDGTSRPVASGGAVFQQELRGRNGGLEGLLVVQHAGDTRHAAPAFTDFVRKLSGSLAVAIETRQLLASQKELLDAIIRLMANAIDAKSPYTGGHCERVPRLAGMLVDRLAAEQDGPYASFVLDEEQRYEFHLAAWLHDCGKVTSPEHIIDKATKLEVIYNRIHEVRMRFEVLWRDAEISSLQSVLAGADEAHAARVLETTRAQLLDDFAFVARCNLGGEFMADADLARLRQISETVWVRHFDKRAGLSGEELRRMGAAGSELPAPERLLSDGPEHLVAWGARTPAVEKDNPANTHGFDMRLPAHAQNMGELYNLGIRRGTLTEEDRFKINDHIVQTLLMLRSLPWPKHLARVPDIAANHHEKMDGQGYPRKLSAGQLTLPDRVMAIADIFEALTAADRPYKSAKTLSESLRIMAFMAKDQHIDATLFRYFLHSGVWRTFAEQFMQAAQCDAVDVAAIEALLPSASA
nr:HD domain-containing phosphohydrolase [Rhodoferax sp.]